MWNILLNVFKITATYRNEINQDSCNHTVSDFENFSRLKTLNTPGSSKAFKYQNLVIPTEKYNKEEQQTQNKKREENVKSINIHKDVKKKLKNKAKNIVIEMKRLEQGLIDFETFKISTLPLSHIPPLESQSNPKLEHSTNELFINERQLNIFVNKIFSVENRYFKPFLPEWNKILLSSSTGLQTRDSKWNSFYSVLLDCSFNLSSKIAEIDKFGSYVCKIIMQGCVSLRSDYVKYVNSLLFRQKDILDADSMPTSFDFSLWFKKFFSDPRTATLKKLIPQFYGFDPVEINPEFHGRKVIAYITLYVIYVNVENLKDFTLKESNIFANYNCFKTFTKLDCLFYSFVKCLGLHSIYKQNTIFLIYQSSLLRKAHLSKLDISKYPLLSNFITRNLFFYVKKEYFTDDVYFSLYAPQDNPLEARISMLEGSLVDLIYGDLNLLVKLKSRLEIINQSIKEIESWEMSRIKLAIKNILLGESISNEWGVMGSNLILHFVYTIGANGKIQFGATKIKLLYELAQLKLFLQ